MSQSKSNKTPLLLRWLLLLFAVMAAFLLKSPGAASAPFFGVGLVVVAYLVASTFLDLGDEGGLFRVALTGTEVVAVVSLVSITGGMGSPLYGVMLAGAVLMGLEAGARQGMIYSVLAALGFVLVPVALGTFSAKLLGQHFVQIVVLLWAGLIGQAVSAGAGAGSRREDWRGESEHMERLDEALYTARKESQARQSREQELYNERRKLEGLMQVAHRLNVIRRPDELLETIVQVAKEQMQVQVCVVFLCHDNQLIVERCDGVSDITAQYMRAPVGHGVFGRLIQSDDSFRYTTVDGLEPLRVFGNLGPFLNLLPASLRGQGVGYTQQVTDQIRNFLVVPLRAPQDPTPFGLLMVGNLLLGDRFTDSHEGYLRILAMDASIAIKNIFFLAELERSHYEMVQVLAQAIEAKDPYTHGHVARVRSYSVKLARAMGLPPETIQEIDTAAMLHDVGKISTPDHILMKPGALTDDEFAIMKEHVVHSARILRDIKSVTPTVQKMVLYHHERWDGKGYPHGIAGDNIPLGAMIIAVADCFDAMTSDRPYRKRFEPFEALKRMESGYGTQFNSDILSYFFAMFDYRPQQNQQALQTVDRIRGRVAENLARSYSAAPGGATGESDWSSAASAQPGMRIPQPAAAPAPAGGPGGHPAGTAGRKVIEFDV